ncbi:hypothetical protein OAQ56_02135 [Alphaproteobacteria bacterium]|nr:hypothetical protein [Alphaproteobacteria bacterium]
MSTIKVVHRLRDFGFIGFQKGKSGGSTRHANLYRREVWFRVIDLG